MKSQRPLILISNDDGIQAGGINALIRFVSAFGDIVVMAPDSPRSGAACSLTVQSPIGFQLVRREPGLQIYKCSGTPADCIKLAKQEILDRTPDLVIGGINHGDNASVNVHYSGTMGIVMEGAICGIPSIGFSVDNHDLTATFEHCGEAVKSIVGSVLENGLPKGVCLNVNFPAEGPLKGIRVCRQMSGKWTLEWDKRVRSNGYTYYWLMGRLLSEEPDAEDTDIWAIRHQYAAVVPTKVDMTAYDYMTSLKERLEDSVLQVKDEVLSDRR